MTCKSIYNVYVFILRISGLYNLFLFIKIKLPLKLETVDFFVSEPTYKIRKESNNYFPHCILGRETMLKRIQKDLVKENDVL